MAKGTLFLFAFLLLFQCTRRAEIIENVDIASLPTQTGDSIFATQSTNGQIVVRLEAPRMEKYEREGFSYELFPNGFDVFSYNDGLLETQIHSKEAKHTTWKNGKEKWEVYGDVEINNYIKGERMLTDTLYWDRFEHKIYTDCFVRMSAPRGYLQGYGMESDEMARNAIIKRPFDSYTKVVSDSLLGEYIDTVNFIGPPLPKGPVAKDLKIKDKEQEEEIQQEQKRL